LIETRAIGRIFRSASAAQDRPWMWTIRAIESFCALTMGKCSATEDFFLCPPIPSPIGYALATTIDRGCCTAPPVARVLRHVGRSQGRICRDMARIGAAHLKRPAADQICFIRRPVRQRFVGQQRVIFTPSVRC
jgi:hypothetical protein